MFSGRFLHLIKNSPTRTLISPHSPPPPDLRRRLPCGTAADTANCRILLHQRSLSQPEDAVTLQSIRIPLPTEDNLIQRIRSSIKPSDAKAKEGEMPRIVISLGDLKKLLKASQIEAARARLKGIPSSSVSYSEFLAICSEAAAGSEECGRKIAAALDHSGDVIVLSDVVFLRPEQVARAVERAISPARREREDSAAKELKEMEAEKSAIDSKAKGQARRELWAGLGLVAAQTASFIRLTFWELSWDVMEPICYFTASFYFMVGYAFFLRTAKEPSFEGFFQSRFAAKQKRLMRSRGFDLSKFDGLRRRAKGLGSAHFMPSCHCQCNSRLAAAATDCS